MLDLVIYETGDGGDLEIKADDLQLISGLTNQVYLALFGGNLAQSTDSSISDDEQRLDYWGNEILEKDNQFNSTFEKTLREISLNTSGIRELENAAKKDLEYLQEFATIEINGSLISVSRFELNIHIIEPSEKSTKLKFVWDGTKEEVIEQKVI